MFFSFEVDWQTWASLIIVGFAAVVTLRHFVGGLKKASQGSGCGSCHGCPAKSQASQFNRTPLFQLESRTQAKPNAKP